MIATDESENKHWYKHIGKFREGAFHEASEEVQNSWFTFCNNILPSVSKKWQNSQRKANHLLSQHVTASDEAFALLEASLKIKKWTKAIKADDKNESEGEDDNNEDDEVKEGINQEEENKEVIKKYFALVKQVQDKRNHMWEGKPWEEGFQKYISQDISTISTKNSNTGGKQNDGDDDEGEPVIEAIIEDWV